MENKVQSDMATDITRPEMEHIDEAKCCINPPARYIDAADRSTGHALCSEHADTHVPPRRSKDGIYLSPSDARCSQLSDIHAPQRTSVFSAASLADLGPWKGEPLSRRTSMQSRVSLWSSDHVEKAAGNPFSGHLSAGPPASGLADMVAMELQEAQRMLAKSHQHVLQLLSTKSNLSSSRQPSRSPSLSSPMTTADDGLHHHVSTTSIMALAGSILGKRRSSAQRSQGASGKPKPVVRASEDLDPISSVSFQRQVSQFELFPCWQGAYEIAVSKAVRAGKLGRGDIKHLNSRFSASMASEHSFKSFVRHVNGEERVIHPLSLRRAIWDTLSLTFVAYDIAFMPLQFFDLTAYRFIVLFMGWLTRIFWTCDIPISFFTGYLLQDGFITVDLYQIIDHYLTGWFLLDLIMVGCDWAELVVRASDEHVGRSVHILQMIRLMRIARMRGIIRLFHFRITSEKFTIIADIAKILCFIITVAHLMACFWYGICDAGDEREKSWIASHHVEDSSLLYKYMMSMHWSLSQFQGGMDEVRPHNLNTRIFNVVAFLTAFMMAAVCVSELTSSMTRLDILASDRSRQLSVLRKYLAQNNISDKLALRVQRNALHAIYEQERLMAEHKVELLAVISDPLREELHFEMYSPVFEVHPFFDEYVHACPHVMQHICHRAVRTWLVTKGDTVFNTGEIPESPQMYIICIGAFKYVEESGEMTELSSEDFISEHTLWIPWMHRGMLHSVMDGRLCAMDARTFQHIACHSKHTEFDPKIYAQEYVKKLNVCQDQGIEISDLPLPEEILNKGNRESLELGSCHSTSSAVVDEDLGQTESNTSKTSSKKPKKDGLLVPRHSSSVSLEEGIQQTRPKRTRKNSVLMVAHTSTMSSSRSIFPELFDRVGTGASHGR